MEAMPSKTLPYSTWLSWSVHCGEILGRWMLSDGTVVELAAKNFDRQGLVGTECRKDFRAMFESVVSAAKARADGRCCRCQHHEQHVVMVVVAAVGDGDDMSSSSLSSPLATPATRAT